MITTSMLTTSRSQRAGATSQSGEAYRQIKEKIVTLELPPAAPIDEARLIAELGLGRTPIREALQRLALENLVVILPRRGTIVADLNMSDLQKIFEIRLELEALAARLAAQRATPAQVAAMEALFADADTLLHNGDNDALIRLDHQAHRLLAQAAHNEFLEETLDRLYNHVLRLWYVALHRVQRLREAVEEHRAIIALVKAGDGEHAAQIMHEHVAAFQDQFLSLR
ncbi:MAG: GntR family transcriptional regulator [Roseiflexaceae bacterium]